MVRLRTAIASSLVSAGLAILIYWLGGHDGRRMREANAAHVETLAIVISAREYEHILDSLIADAGQMLAGVRETCNTGRIPGCGR